MATVTVGSVSQPKVREQASTRSADDLPDPSAEPGRIAAGVEPPVSPAGEAWLLMRELFISQRPRFNAITHELGLAPPLALALHYLDPDRPVTMGELAGELCYDNSNVTGIVDRLEESGYVERRPDPRDRRARLVQVTAEGVRARRRLLARTAEPPPALAGLGEEDQAALRDVLRRALAR